MLVEGQVSEELFEALVFFFEWFEAAQFRNAEAGILASPAVEGLFADARFTAEIDDRGTGLGAS